MEHFYDKIQGWFYYDSVYSDMVKSCPKDCGYTFVEVGSWKGRSTAYMGVEIINSGNNIKFYAVDTWKGSEEHYDKNGSSYDPIIEQPDGLYNLFLSNIEPVKSVVTPLRMTSLEAAKCFVDESLAFVMLDASHDYENVKADIDAWYPKVAVNGILSGDDLDWPGVGKAVFDSFAYNLATIHNKVWMKQKLTSTV